MREKSPSRSRDHSTCAMRWRKTTAVVYSVSSSQYDLMMSVRYFGRHHLSLEWNIYAYPCPNGGGAVVRGETLLIKEGDHVGAQQ